MKIENAELIAIRALQYLAGDEEQLGRFAALTGTDLSNLRAQANDRGFLIGVLDFFVNHEPTLMAFCANADIPPGEIMQAKQALDGRLD